MPRALCVGNGNLQVNIDKDMNIRDMFFPFVGLENHVSGHFCRFGVWVDGRFSWIDSSWNKKFSYKTDSLVTDVSLKKAESIRDSNIVPFNCFLTSSKHCIMN